MEKNSSKKGDIKISLLGLLIGISLIVAGVYGIVFTLLHGDSCWRSCCYNHGFGYFQTRICQKNLTDTFTEKRC